MKTRQLGNTGLQVSRLGLGLSELGYRLSRTEEQAAARLLNTALDLGINFFDTSACYGISEELVGRTVANRRDEYVLATKAGHVTGDYQGTPWTYETVRDSVDRSLRRLQTDHLDIVQLHSCDVDVLERGDVIRALLDARQAGKTWFVGYSGDNEAVLWAVEHADYFDTIETSYNLVDQKARAEILPGAEEQGLGIIAKRPIANGAWGAATSPSGYAAEYHRRYQIVSQNGPIPGAPADPILLSLGFALANDLVDTAIVGTTDLDHLEQNVRWVEHDLPIAREAVRELERRFEEYGAQWDQET
ncbi:MAG TPA: aldo/keto reductase [Anaerolineae bacterium]|nr:aldo/keto reductase [Anaerolineae bacterium]